MISAIFKFVFAGGIIYWLLQSNRLDFSLILKSLSSGYSAYIATSIYILIIFLATIRWKLILEVQANDSLPLKKILPINWIGLFFSTFLPGVVTGDVVKLLYVKDLNKDFTKTFLLTSVFIDRIIGLCGLLFVAGITSFFNYDSLSSLSLEVKTLIHFNFLLFIGSVCFVAGLVMPIKIQNSILNLCNKLPKVGDRIKKTLEQAWLLGKYKKTTFICLFLSMLCQFLSITSIWILTKPFYPAPVPLSLLLGVIPIALISIAIPISPAGAGVGPFIFEKLFNALGISNGASLFNLHFIVLIIVNLLGVIPYVLFGKKHSIDEAEEFDSETETVTN